MRKLLAIAIFVALQGCVSQANIEKSLGQMYNAPTSGSSQFDKSKYIRISKMLCSNIVVFELYQENPKHNNGIVLLNVGTKTITNIGADKALHIKIDGKTSSFESKDIMTEHDKLYYYAQRFRQRIQPVKYKEILC